MENAAAIDMEKLRADMAARVEGTSARQFSREVTGGRNPDWYRNFIGGQDKRISADVFAGIVTALGRDPAEYIEGLEPSLHLPSESVLTSAFATMLDSLGIPPHEDGRAHKLALSFPNALKRALNFHAPDDSGEDALHATGPLESAEDRPAA